MPRPGEFAYYERIGAENREQAVNKPFSDERRGSLLMELGAIFLLLPPPPCRVLECGCGPGWLTYVLAKAGYRVTGQDVNPQAIELARTRPLFETSPGMPEFLTCDYEELAFENEFDAVVFFDSLHHATDIRRVIGCVFRALKPGGRMIASEPGVGHAVAARTFAEQFDVTDKDMPPSLVLRVGRSAGFSEGRIYPHAALLGSSLYSRERGLGSRLAGLFRSAFHTGMARRNGITVLVK